MLIDFRNVKEVKPSNLLLRKQVSKVVWKNQILWDKVNAFVGKGGVHYWPLEGNLEDSTSVGNALRLLDISGGFQSVDSGQYSDGVTGLARSQGGGYKLEDRTSGNVSVEFFYKVTPAAGEGTEKRFSIRNYTGSPTNQRGSHELTLVYDEIAKEFVVDFKIMVYDGTSQTMKDLPQERIPYPEDTWVHISMGYVQEYNPFTLANEWRPIYTVNGKVYGLGVFGVTGVTFAGMLMFTAYGNNAADALRIHSLDEIKTRDHMPYTADFTPPTS